ncbi:MAG: HD-GYP domain-containing protein [Clostridiales bacterium]|nr:HD-GYP domain-containing protein [Clostridiales bacterium]
MRYVAIENVAEGTYLAKPIYNAHGTILLSEHFQLTDVYLKKLKELGFLGLYIEDDISKDIVIEEVVSEKLRIDTVVKLENIIENTGDFEELGSCLSEIVDNIIENKNLLLQVNKLFNYHSYTYVHCVNVGILSVCMGVKLDFDREKLLKLGMSGILHDIGKNNIPLEILDKPGKLTKEEFDLIKMHPVYGYTMLKGIIELSSVTKMGILQHHERCDGSGYPKGLKNEDISEFGKIIAIADTYDALTSDRSYRPAYTPWEAYEFLLGDGGIHYDFDILKVFNKCIAVFTVGTCVELSDGTRAIVLKNNPSNPLRPVLRNLENNIIIDLVNDKNHFALCITKLVE